ncbi:MAG: outer membrane beta-barrel domain-containing protein, partial [Bacteriovoracaceae bacterium]
LSFGTAPFKASASEKDLYDFLWLDPDKKVYVLQNKIFPKTGSFYADIGYLNNLSGEFQNTNGGQLRMGYFLNEEFALELNHMQYGNSNNAAYESVKIVSGTEPFIRRSLSSTSLFVIWSPFYGKINTFNKIFYFDWYFGAGTGSLKMESNLESVTNPGQPSRFDSENYTPVQFKSGFKAHINRNVHLGVEFLNSNFQAGSPKSPSSKNWKQSNDLIFSLGVSF